MNGMKKSKWIIGILLITMILIPSACGGLASEQDSGEEGKDGDAMQGTEEMQDGAEDASGNVIVVQWEFPFWY